MAQKKRKAKPRTAAMKKRSRDNYYRNGWKWIEKSRARALKWGRENSQKAVQRVREWRKKVNLKRPMTAAAKARLAAYAAAHPVKIRANHARHRKNPKYKARVKTWKKTNPGRVRASAVKRKFKKNYTSADIKNLWIEQEGKCRYCKRPMTKTGPTKETVDHVIPFTKGGTNGPENIVLACHQCNCMKGKQTLSAFLARKDRPNRKTSG